MKIKLYILLKKFILKSWLQNNEEFVIIQRFGNDYTKATIMYQQDPGVKMYVTHKLNQFSRLNFLKRAKFIGQFDTCPILTLQALSHAYIKCTSLNF